MHLSKSSNFAPMKYFKFSMYLQVAATVTFSVGTGHMVIPLLSIYQSFTLKVLKYPIFSEETDCFPLEIANRPTPTARTPLRGK